MKRLTKLNVWDWKPAVAVALGVVLLFVTVLTLFGQGRHFDARAQEPPGGGEIQPDQFIQQTQMATEESVPIVPEPPSPGLYSAEQPVLTDEQIDQLELALLNTNLSISAPAASALSDAEEEGKDPAAEPKLVPLPTGSESRITFPRSIRTGDAAPESNSPEPLNHPNPGIYTRFKSRDNWPGADISASNRSNIQETSLAQSGRFAWATGNWYAARSGNGGQHWTFVNPFADMPDFCCDQVVIHDGAHDRFYWYRQSNLDFNGNNRFFLTVINGRNNAVMCTYKIRSTRTNPRNHAYDYPHLQLGADYLYIATNVFSGHDWARSQMIRIPTSNLSNCASTRLSFFTDTENFNFVPVQGARHTMYWASNWPVPFVPNKIRIYRWHEDQKKVSSFLYKTPAWTPSFRGTASCPARDGHNWVARFDHRLMTGARYQIMGTNVKHPGRQVLGFWWNVAQGGTFPWPYIEGFAVFEDNLKRVPGPQGRPLIWNQDLCFAYPSISPNQLGDLGMIVNWARGGVGNPNLAVGIADDFTTAPPGWALHGDRISRSHPLDEVWGDYNTVRKFQPSERFWIASSHYIRSVNHCRRCGRAVYIVFGRGRDHNNYTRWFNR